MYLPNDVFNHPKEALLHFARTGNGPRIRAMCELGLIKNINEQDRNGVTPLMYAALNGHVEVAEILVKAGANALERNAGGCDAPMAAAQTGEECCPIPVKYRGSLQQREDPRRQLCTHLAVNHGHIKTVELLTRAGASVLAQNNDGFTAFLVGCGTGQANVVKMMLTTLTSMNEIDTKVEMMETAQPDNSTPVTIASGLGYSDVVSTLIEHDANVHTRNNDGFDAFLAAIANNHTAVVQLLLENNLVDLENARYENESSSLHIAVDFERIDVVELLTRAGANVLAQNKGGVTAFYIACARNQIDLVRRMVETLFMIDSGEMIPLMVEKARDDGVTPIIAASACEGGHTEVLQFLLEIGADVESRTSTGVTPLMLASRLDCPEAVVILISRNAQLESKSVLGRTALWEAVSKNQFEVVETLIRYGADVNTKDARETTPLQLSSGEGMSRIVDLLLRNGADVNVQNVVGSTALVTASCEGYADIVEMLLVYGANMEHQPRMPQGGTALEAAAQHGHLEVVRLLAKCGAKIDEQSNTSYTPLIAAAGHGHADICEFLIESKVSLEPRSVQGYTALHLAVAKRSQNTVKVLVEAGIDVCIKDNEGLTALDLAARDGDFELVEYLQAAPSAKKMSNAEERRIWPVSSLLEFYGHEVQTLPTVNPLWFVDWSAITVNEAVEPVNCLAATIYEGTWLGSSVTIIKPTMGKTFDFTIQDVDGPIDDQAVRRMFVSEVCRWLPLNHPHVLRLFGACHRGQPFFVVERVVENLRSYLKVNRHRIWRTFYQVALGLQYLHERGFVHQRLHGDAIAIGEDGLPKLRGFGFFLVEADGSGQELDNQRHWFSPAVFKGGKLSADDDVWSLGMCIIEAVSGDLPYAREVAEGPNVRDLVENMQLPKRHSSFRDEEWNLVTRMACQRGERLTMSAVILELQDLARRESDKVAPANELITTVDTLGDLLEQAKSSCKGPEMQIYHPEMELVHRLSQILTVLRATKATGSDLAVYSGILTRFIGILEKRNAVNEVSGYAISRQLANSVFSLHCEVDRLEKQQKVHVTSRWREMWQNSWVEQQHLFGEELRDAMNESNLSSLSVNDRAIRVEKLTCMLFELAEHGTSYSAIPTRVTIAARSQIEVEFGEKAHDWFLPWYEVTLNGDEYFQKGGFGEVFHGEWMGSDVVLKKLKPSVNFDPATFIREVEIWFKLFHPNVVKLFGACHVGQIFFVSEWAVNGQLDTYLEDHGRHLVWEKLLEAALGLQYLHANNIIHCDLICNNILVGRDRKAKLADFGLSSISRGEEIDSA